MAKVLVSIISEHLIPNYHLHLHLADEIQKHILITTSKMNDDGYTLYFKNLVKNNTEVEELILDDFRDFEKINENLNNINPEYEYIVNITGGTKVISLSVFNYFRQLNSSIYYVAIGTNSCQKIYPVQEPVTKFSHQLSLIDYLKLYGFSVEKSNFLMKTPVVTEKLFHDVKLKQYNALSVFEIRDAFGENNKRLVKKEVDYLKGLWFEEYIYNIIKDKLNLQDSQIALNVKVRRKKDQKTDDNEFDVMYVHNNKLYVVECKSSIGRKNEHKKNLENFLYKLAAAVKDMGLQVTPLLVVSGYLEKYKSIINRADILKIHLIGAEKFNNTILFDSFIKLL
jgi:hypothetical protein